MQKLENKRNGWLILAQSLWKQLILSQSKNIRWSKYNERKMRIFDEKKIPPYTLCPNNPNDTMSW